MANKFRKNDQVIVISGSNKGKIGKIKSINKDKITIDGVNLATIHKKPSNNTPGQIIKLEKPIHISNISHVENGKPVKIRFDIDKVSEDKDKLKNFAKKSRVSKKSGKKID